MAQKQIEKKIQIVLPFYLPKVSKDITTYEHYLSALNEQAEKMIKDFKAREIKKNSSFEFKDSFFQVNSYGVNYVLVFKEKEENFLLRIKAQEDKELKRKISEEKKKIQEKEKAKKVVKEYIKKYDLKIEEL